MVGCVGSVACLDVMNGHTVDHTYIHGTTTACAASLTRVAVDTFAAHAVGYACEWSR